MTEVAAQEGDMKVCGTCGSVDDVVTVCPPDEEEFNACRTCYARWKRRHVAEGVEVHVPRCSNCGGLVSGGMCIQCGNHCSDSGEVIRVG